MPPSSSTQRPSAASSAVPIAHQRALISPLRIPFPTQRGYAIALFVVLQSIKAYDILLSHRATYDGQYSGMMLKWWVWDIAFLTALWIVKIPWLQFSGLKTIVLSLLMMVFDAVLFEIPAFIIIGALTKATFDELFGHPIGVSRATLVNRNQVIFNSSHILGRHTVHILPYGTAKFNHQDEFYCIPTDAVGQKEIHIPILLNSTIPKSITVSRFNVDNGAKSVYEYHGSELRRATEVGQEKRGIELYYIQVSKPGVYKLENIVSKDGSDVRLYSKQAYVLPCPTAQFVSEQEQDYCQGEQKRLHLNVQGVPPFKVEYVRRVGDVKTPVRLDSIQPDAFASPLIKMSHGLKSAAPEFFLPQSHKDYDWAVSHEVSVALDLRFDKAEKYGFYLQRVTDGVGNSVLVKDRREYLFHVHSHPTAEFECGATHPVQLFIGENYARIPLKLKGSGAWNVTYQFTPKENVDGEEQFTKELSASWSELEAYAPGEYRLLSVHDQYCSGNVMFPSACQVVQPPFPSVKVSFTAIPSECSGNSEIGMRFLAELKGVPPFQLEYKVIQHVGKTSRIVDQKRERSEQSRHIFTYLPSSSGEYTYEFYALDDANYKKLDPQLATIQQIVRPQPSAKFSGELQRKRSIRTCLGDSLQLNVDLSGTGPFHLYWTFGKQLHSAVVEGNSYTIDIPPLQKPGSHVVSLVKIQDANACVKELESRDVIIDVRRERPTAFFSVGDDKETTIEVIEGTSVPLPLRLTGEGPWRLTYRNVEKDKDREQTSVLHNPNDPLVVREEGHYELLKVEDSICKGDVLLPNYLVRWAERPTLSIPEDQATLNSGGVYVRPPVCRGKSDAFDIAFTGHAPYYTVYDEFLAESETSPRHLLGKDDISSGLRKNHISLKTQKSGIYTYEFTKISDHRYTQPFTIAPLVLMQHVYETPTVRFTKHQEKRRVMCVGENLMSDSTEPLWIELTGQAPFHVAVRFKNDSSPQGRVENIENIQAYTYRLDMPFEVEAAGRYTIEVLSVQDAHGCHSVAEGADTSIAIQALDSPVITPAGQCPDLCVGDMLDYTLSGVGPFTVAYEFDRRSEEIRSATSKLSMLADKAGNLTIISVGDKRNQCRSFPKEMTKIVHEIPTSLVSGGKDIIENIREGDMVQAVVDLVGTPPFSFVWQRSEVVWDTKRKRHFKGKVLESHSVQDIEEYQYLINTSTEGIIEITSIKDRFCQYPRIAL
ncbi:hypothetical protein BDF14DRAFT_1790894 [Spinellus fusiger]|nr:hypothetical protein BDF14DRAFT_1790894 [Spinellus fusiger]